MSRSKNAFHVIGYGLILVLLIGLLSCGPQKLGYAEETKIALVTDIGGRGDLSFNDMAFKGADKAAEDFGFELTVAQPSSEADYLPTLRDLARTGQYELIIGIGFLLEDAMDETAQEFSDQKFGFLDAAVDHENVKNVLFKEQENSALAGALAAMLAAHYEYSEVGAVLGIEIPVLWRFEAGYRYGIHWGLNFYESVTGERPDVGLLWNYTGTFDDVAKGKSAAEAQLAQDAGVIFNVAAPLGFGILEAINDKLSAEDRDAGPPFMIGVDANQDYMGEGNKVIASALKRLDQATYQMIEETLEGEFQGGTEKLGLAGGGVGISRFTELKEFLPFAVNAEALEEEETGQIEKNWLEMRDKIPYFVWDGVNKLENLILTDQLEVPSATTESEIKEIREQYP